MASVFAYAPAVKKPIKLSNNNVLLYYDAAEGKMLQFRGGMLKYDYVYDATIKQSRVVPRAVDLKTNRTETVKDVVSVEKWFEKFAQERLHFQTERVSSNSLEGWVEFEVPSLELDEFTEELEIGGFEYQVN
tara:strand:+ start:4093 stop:4488 length:396 start_codon:yes stop_codon:yes gene_type:complete